MILTKLYALKFNDRNFGWSCIDVYISYVSSWLNNANKSHVNDLAVNYNSKKDEQFVWYFSLFPFGLCVNTPHYD